MRSKMGLVLVGLVIALALVAVGSAQANAGTTETITTHLVVTSPISAAPPYVLTDEGTFTASGAFDASGTFSVQWMFAAFPAPSTAVGQWWETLTDTHGYILTLRCSVLANDYSNAPAYIPFGGTCAVISGTGPYASLHGSGKAIGTANEEATPTFDTTVAFKTS